MPDALHTKAELEAALRRLAELLSEAGVRSRIYIVGGAALTIAYGVRDATRDIDASIVPMSEVAPFIGRVAREMGLPRDWLNDHANGYISRVKDDPAPVDVLNETSVAVTAASAETLLAMKIRASRPRLDERDIEFLLDATGTDSVDSAVTLFEHYYPEDPLPPHALAILGHAFATKTRNSGGKP